MELITLFRDCRRYILGSVGSSGTWKVRTSIGIVIMLSQYHWNGHSFRRCDICNPPRSKELSAHNAIFIE